MDKKNVLVAIICGATLLHVGLHGFWDETKAFFTAFVRNPRAVGSAIPSSRFFADAVTHYIDARGSKRILEIGAGTGAYTQKIIEKMGKHDLLDVIEIDSELCALLRKKFKDYKNVHIHCVSILEWHAAPYDIIVSALPHNVFEPAFVDAVIEKYKELISDNGILSYVELAGFSKLKRLFLSGKKKEKFLKIFNATSRFRQEFEFDRDFIVRNIPPAQVYHLRIRKESQKA